MQKRGSKGGSPEDLERLDSRLRGKDRKRCFPAFCETINVVKFHTSGFQDSEFHGSAQGTPGPGLSRPLWDKDGKGFHDYAMDFSKTELDEAVRKRDEEFLKRLKALYWKQ